MAYVGIDLHKRESQICVIDETGQIVKEVRVASRPNQLGKALEHLKGNAKVLLEASTLSEWAARCLESHGFTVIVGDPNYAPMMGERRKRKIKTDRRDARALAEACRIGAFRPAYRMSDDDRRARGRIAVRAMMLRHRTQLIGLTRAQLLQHGVFVPACSAEAFAKTVRKLELTENQEVVAKPALEMIASLDDQISNADKAIEVEAEARPLAKRLTTHPGVGSLTALMFVAVIGRADRFNSAGHASSYVGLVPGEDSSGDGVKRTGITKTGNKYLRTLLVQCAWSLIRSKNGGALKQWALRLAKKRKKKISAVGTARRLARVLWSMMLHDTDYDPNMNRERALEVLIRPAA